MDQIPLGPLFLETNVQNSTPKYLKSEYFRAVSDQHYLQYWISWHAIYNTYFWPFAGGNILCNSTFLSVCCRSVLNVLSHSSFIIHLVWGNWAPERGSHLCLSRIAGRWPSHRSAYRQCSDAFHLPAAWDWEHDSFQQGLPVDHATEVLETCWNGNSPERPFLPESDMLPP